MVLTLRTLKETVRQELGRDPRRSSGEELVNEAGEAWADAHDWQYLRTQSISVDLVPGTFKYNLETISPYALDVGDKLHRPNSVWSPIPVLDWSTFEHASQTFLWDVGREFQPIATIVEEKGASDDRPETYLEVFPSKITETVVLEVTLGWVQVDLEDDFIQVPKALERSFIEFVRRYAMGREKTPQTNVDLEVAQFFAGPLGKAAVRRDGKKSGKIPRKYGRAGQNYAMRKMDARGFHARDEYWCQRYRAHLGFEEL